MKKCSSVDEVVAVVQQQQYEAVDRGDVGFVDEDDFDMFISDFRSALEEFFAEHNVVAMSVLVGDEIEDEKLGTAVTDHNGECVYEEVYMSYRFGYCRIFSI